jgi:two-component system, LytTR family, response regulator
MKLVQCIIVDDEPLARELLSAYISRLKGWELKASCRSVAEAYEALYQNEIAVIFLDIQMPDVTGIDFLKALKHPPLIVFTTAYAEYAVQAFDLKAADYLLKPITEDRFREAVDKVEHLLSANEVPSFHPQTDHVFLKQDNRLVKVHFEDIRYIEALKDFSKVYLKEKNMLVSAHLKMMEDMLPQTHFLRIHRSYIVALNAVSAVLGNAVEIGKQEIPIGNTYRDQLMKRLGL